MILRNWRCYKEMKGWHFHKIPQYCGNPIQWYSFFMYNWVDKMSFFGKFMKWEKLQKIEIEVV